MKLSNKQMDLVVDMIYMNVKELSDAKQKKANIKLKAEGEALAKRSMLFLTLTKSFKILGTAVDKIRLKSYGLNDAFPELYERTDSYYSYTDFSSSADFVRQIAEKYVNKHQPKALDKRDIERQVLMSSLNVKDLQELVDAITKQFLPK